MPWMERDTLSLRREFILMAAQPDASIRDLCRRFGISPKTGDKWMKRFSMQGTQGLLDRSRRPGHSPSRIPPELEQAVVGLRDKHRAWGGRKIRARLPALGYTGVPAASTVTGILKRHGRLDEAESAKHKAWRRFEHEAPKRLWRMDFKGHFPMRQGRCHPLTVLDDHSRFSVGLAARGDERAESVRARLTGLFRRHGLPGRMLMDRPWGSDKEHRYTPLGLRLLRLGVAVSHGRPYHPQTQGEDERFHRTLKVEAPRYERFENLQHCQRRFDDWREIYKHERPHEALGPQVPASGWRVGERTFPEVLPPIEYGRIWALRCRRNRTGPRGDQLSWAGIQSAQGLPRLPGGHPAHRGGGRDGCYILPSSIIPSIPSRKSA